MSIAIRLFRWTVYCVNRIINERLTCRLRRVLHVPLQKLVTNKGKLQIYMIVLALVRTALFSSQIFVV